jgi:ADP-ribose pyrophosphatase YjhB (NUDIX family)
MSEYIRSLRARIGNTVLEVPTVSVVVQDDRARVLLVRHAEGNDWTTPGGMIEPFETPADAAVRETWEETGLHVRLTRIVAVLGGAQCGTTYRNGDRIAWVATVFCAEAIGGALRPDGEEALEAAYFEPREIAELTCKPHVALVMGALAARSPQTQFAPPSWAPPTR